VYGNLAPYFELCVRVTRLSRSCRKSRTGLTVKNPTRSCDCLRVLQDCIQFACQFLTQSRNRRAVVDAWSHSVAACDDQSRNFRLDDNSSSKPRSELAACDGSPSHAVVSLACLWTTTTSSGVIYALITSQIHFPSSPMVCGARPPNVFDALLSLKLCHSCVGLY